MRLGNYSREARPVILGLSRRELERKHAATVAALTFFKGSVYYIGVTLGKWKRKWKLLYYIGVTLGEWKRK